LTPDNSIYFFIKINGKLATNFPLKNQMISLTFIRLELLSSLFLVLLDAEFVKAEKIIGFIIVKIKKIIKIITTIILEDKLANLVRNLHFF
jgi:hypothetical protein